MSPLKKPIKNKKGIKQTQVAKLLLCPQPYQEVDTKIKEYHRDCRDVISNHWDTTTTTTTGTHGMIIYYDI